MRIGVTGTFQFADILGGALGATTVCQLELSGDYSLIYAEVANLDILQTLNTAFDLGLGDASLLVESAGFFTFSRRGAAAPQPLEAIFPNSPVPATVAKTAIPVVDATSFWLTVDLASKDHDQGLFGSIADIGVAAGTQLSLSANFASGAAAAAAIKSATYTLALDGKVTLFDLFNFENVSINYSVGEATRILVTGELGVSLFDTQFAFAGSVLSDSGVQAVTANVAAQGTADLASLFGGSFPHIAFTGVRFNLYYPYGANKQSAQFMVRGGCSFGGMAFAGLLYIVGTTPVLGSVVFTSAASITTLFDQCLPGASWPSSLIDLTLKPNSQVYYNNGAKPLQLTLSNDGSGPTLLPVPAGPASSTPSSTTPVTPAPVPTPPIVVAYQPGFNASASFTLSLLDTIEVGGDVVVNHNGVTAAIDIAAPINLYVVQITRQGDPTRGPVLSISTSGQTGTMTFAAALLFFQEDFGADATVSLTKADANLLVAVTLTPTQNYPPLLTTADRLGFSYSRAQGFQLTDWPAFSAAQDIIDFFSTLKSMANSGSGCGQIADFVCKNLLVQTYTMTPAFSSGTSGLELTLSITCTLSFAGTSETTQIASFTLPKAFVLPIPTTMSLDALWPAIVTEIEAAAESFVEALLANGSVVATFLVLFAGQQAVSYAATLICRGLANAAVDAAAAAGAAAAGDALGTAAAAVGAILAGVAASNGGHGGGGGGGGGGSAPAKPANVTALIDGAQITAAWQLSGGAQAYVATLTGPAGQIATSGVLSYDATQYRFGAVQAPAPLPASATIAVTASNGYGASDAGTTPIVFLAAPTGLRARTATAPAPDVAVEVAWTGAAVDTGYTVTVTGAAAQTVQSQTASAILTFPPADPAGAYGVVVVATGGAATIPSPPSTPLSLTRLAAPINVTSEPVAATAPDVAVKIAWSLVDAATGYVVAVTGGKSATLDTTIASATLTLAATDPVGEYAIAVTAIGGAASIPSAASAPLALTRLPAPTGLAGRATAPTIEASWTAVANAASYVLAWVSPTGATGTQPVPAGAGRTVTGSIALPAPVADGVWKVTVQALPADGVGVFIAGPPSAPIDVTVTIPPQTPAQLAASCLASGVDGAACGARLIATFPTLTAVALGTAMAQGGYAAAATGDGLHAAFPSITPAQMAAALAYAYPATPSDLAQTRFAAGVDGAECGEQLICAFPNLAVDPFAMAMAQGGYTAAATGDGLHAAFPSITPAQMAAALAYAYPATPSDLAQTRFAAGVDGAECGEQLICAFPNLAVEPFAMAMAQGGYAAAATGDGLHAAFPSITPAQMAAALAQAYP